MRDTKKQLRWEIEVLKLALHKATFAIQPVRGSQHWIEEAAMELTRRGVRVAIESGEAQKMVACT